MFPKSIDKLFWLLVKEARRMVKMKYSWGEQMFDWYEIRRWLMGYKWGYLDAEKERR